MDLRDQITEALSERIWAPGHEWSETTVHKNHRYDGTCGICRGDTGKIADAVMEVVEADAERRRAYTERRVELARAAEKAIWERRMREEKEEADAIIAEETARVRALEAENQKLRHELAVARGETVGTVPTWAEYEKAERDRAAREARDQPKPHVTLERARELAALRARQLKEEK